MAQTQDEKSSDILLAIAQLGIVAIIVTFLINGMRCLVDSLQPEVGDIVYFDPRKVVSPDMEPSIEVTPADARSGSCLLDVHAMRMARGSLIIEAMTARSKLPYRVHWAGGPSSNAHRNCGNPVDLLLNREEFVALKMAASQ